MMVSSIRATAVIDWDILQMNAQTLFALIAMGWGISPVSPEDTRCCICKATTHVARFCHLSWYKSPSPYDCVDLRAN